MIVYITVTLVMFLSVGITTAASGEVKSAVFGPVTYERTTGSPDLFEADFTVPSPDDNFTLYIKNGNRKNRVSSAIITLNDNVIVGQNEFNQQVEFINKSIKLRPHNVLQVKLNSNPSQTLTIWIEGEYLGPVVDILFPIDNTSLPVTVPLDGSQVILNTTVIGTIQGQNITTATLKVNNYTFTIPVINGSISHNITLIEGLNKIMVNAVDSAGNVGSRSIQVLVQNTNMDLDIPLPPPSPYQNKKLGTALNYTAYLYETQGMDAARSFIASGHTIIEGDNISSRIVIKEFNQMNLDILVSLGINITYIDGNMLYTWTPIQKIRDLEEIEFVEMIYLDSKPVPQSIIEGDA